MTAMLKKYENDFVNLKNTQSEQQKKIEAIDSKLDTIISLLKNKNDEEEDQNI